MGFSAKLVLSKASRARVMQELHDAACCACKVFLLIPPPLINHAAMGGGRIRGLTERLFEHLQQLIPARWYQSIGTVFCLTRAIRIILQFWDLELFPGT